MWIYEIFLFDTLKIGFTPIDKKLKCIFLYQVINLIINSYISSKLSSQQRSNKLFFRAAYSYIQNNLDKNLTQLLSFFLYKPPQEKTK